MNLSVQVGSQKHKQCRILLRAGSHQAASSAHLIDRFVSNKKEDSFFFKKNRLLREGKGLVTPHLSQVLNWPGDFKKNPR